MAELEVCRLEELPPGTVRIVEAGPLLSIGVYNCGGELYGLEDRCSHDDGPLCEGDFDCEEGSRSAPGTAPGSTSRAAARCRCRRTSPSTTYPVRVRDDGVVVVDV